MSRFKQKKPIYSTHGPPRKAVEDVWSPFMPKDKETGAWPVPEEGDDISPFTCDACRYEHNMKWINTKTGSKMLVCYRCDNFVLPVQDNPSLPPPPPVKKAKRD